MVMVPCLQCGTPYKRGTTHCASPNRAVKLASYNSAEYRRNRAFMVRNFNPGQPCFICHEPIFDRANLSIEHVKALRDGGSNSLGNLAYAHTNPCNSSHRTYAPRLLNARGDVSSDTSKR